MVNCEYFKVGAFEVGIRLDVAECRDDFDVGVDLSTPPQLGSNHGANVEFWHWFMPMAKFEIMFDPPVTSNQSRMQSLLGKA